MDYMSFAQYQESVSLVLDRAASAIAKAVALSEKAFPHAIQFGWEAVDTAMAEGRSERSVPQVKTIAASIFSVDLAVRFWDWTEDPQNKARANQLADQATAFGSQALNAWCFACDLTIEAGYQSRPYIEEAYDKVRELAIEANTIVRFLLALQMLIARQDWEEVEEYQTALPAAPRSVALLAPAYEPQAFADDPWLAPASELPLRAAVQPAAAISVAAPPMLLAPALEPAPKSAKAGGRKSRKTASGNRRKTTGAGAKNAKSDRKANVKAKVGGTDDKS